MAGAPGSKWSSVCKNIYYSPNIDRSDYNNDRTYYHSAWGHPELMHLGTYFDPGMEFGKQFMQLPQLGKQAAEAEFDRPFSGEGVRIIKSHVFCHHLDHIKNTWPDCPVVLVHRNNDACLGWWVRCGQFNITYPNYQYYSNLEMMAMHIDQQNTDLKHFAMSNRRTVVGNNHELATELRIALPPQEYLQNYQACDIEVMIA